MKHQLIYKLLFWLIAGSSLLLASPGGTDRDIDIPYEKFVLDNGLTLIVHEDRKAPIVAVNLWYHVGSKNEKPGKSGFAHLFEHLMFNGSEHFNQDYYEMTERLGATDINGTTNEDRTNYFQNVPTSALDIILWLESDRMGHLLGVVTQEKLDIQRGVVQNEKRQYENQPYGVAYELMTFSTWPKHHPYSWTIIGSMDDLNAASLEDVQDWFKTYYGPANATMVVAGDISPKDALEKVKRYFGHIPSGPPVARHSKWVPQLDGEQRQIAQDRVSASRIYKIWNVPEWGNKALAYLNVAEDILGGSKTARLNKRLVFDEQIASGISVYTDVREIASQFVIEATAKPGQDLAAVEKAIDEELARFIAEGPTEKELQQMKTQYRAGFVRGIERIGGFGGKSDILAMSETYGGNPDAYKKSMQWIADASAEQVKAAAAKWLNNNRYVLEIHPFPEYKTSEPGVERIADQPPAEGNYPDVKFPDIQKATLSNGLKIVLAERSSVPVVDFSLQLDAGYAADQFGIPGTAKMTMSMLDEGTKKKSALEISEELSLLGANLGTGANLDMSYVNLSALKSNLEPSLDVFADIILNPAFPEKDLDRLRKQRLAGIQQEKSSPVSMALRVLPKYIYGEGHAYSNPLTGSGDEASNKALRRQDLQKFHNTWFKPNNATMVVTGDIDLTTTVALLEERFKKWKKGNVPTKNVGVVQPKEKSLVLIMDKPGALQSLILSGQIAPPKANDQEIAIEAMNNVIGGQFTSRVNMNLREDKHWAYGAYTFVYDAKGQRPFMVYAPVQTDKTAPSLKELSKELKDFLGPRPASADELEKVQKNMTLALPGVWETNASVSGSLKEMVRFGYADDYFKTYASNVNGLNLTQIERAAKTVITPDKMVWLIVGDREKIIDEVKALNLGEIRLIDTEGNLLVGDDDLTKR